MIKQIYLDMDGVLDDFDKQAFKYEIFYMNEKGERKVDWKKLHTIGPKYWSEIEPYKAGLEMYHSLLELCQERGISLKILTAGPGSQCNYGKREWLAKYCPEIPAEDIIIKRKGPDKAEEANPESILIDDMIKNINAFKEAGGNGFLYEQNPDQAIEFCKNLM